MAFTEVTTMSTVGGVSGPVIPPFYSDFLRENLYPNLYIRQLGTAVTIPQGYGDRIKIPRWENPITHTGGQAGLAGAVTAVQGMTEGTVISSFSNLSAEFITGDVTGFAGSRSYSDKLIMVTKANFIEGALEALGREMSYRVDKFDRVNISAATTLLNIAATTNKAVQTDTLIGKNVAKIAPNMDARSVPRWEDASFVGVTNPLAQYDMYTDISATGFVSVARYNDAIKIYRGEVGQMYGIRWLLSPAIPFIYGAAGTTASLGISTDVTGCNALVFAPDAFYTVELEKGGVEVIHHPPGSGGSTGDPANQVGSVAVKLYHGVASAPQADYRVLRVPHGLALKPSV